MAPRSLGLALGLVAATISVPRAHAQLLRGFVEQGVPGSSYESSSSWSFGQDGEMHEMSSEVVQIDDGPQHIEKRIVCKDGFCEEEVVTQPPQHPQWEHPHGRHSHKRRSHRKHPHRRHPHRKHPHRKHPHWGHSHRHHPHREHPHRGHHHGQHRYREHPHRDHSFREHPHREHPEVEPTADYDMEWKVQDIMQSIMGRHHHAAMPAVEWIAEPADDLEVDPAAMAQQDPSKHPKLRGMLRHFTGEPSEIMPVPPFLSSSYLPGGRSFTRSVAVACLIASSAGLLAVLVGALRMHGGVSARELPAMHGSLAEPLTSAEGEAPSGPAAAVVVTKRREGQVVTAEGSAQSSAQDYLEGLYAKVLAKAEHQALSQYLATLYTRTAV